MAMNEKVEFSREEIISVVRELREMVISLDRIGGAAVDMPNEHQWKEATIEYLLETRLLNRLSSCRAALENKFSDEPLGEDDMSDFDREVDDIEYWSFAKYKDKHGL